MTTVQARIERLSRGEYSVHCGKCGQFLDVAFATWTQAPPTNDNLTMHFWGGWRYEDGVWRPTKHHRYMREQAKRDLKHAAGVLQRQEIERALKYNDFRWKKPARTPERDPAFWNDKPEAAPDEAFAGHYFAITDENRHRHTLPLRAICPECNEDNEIDVG